MKVNVQKLPKSSVKIKIEVEPSEIEVKLDLASKNIAKDMKMPGFRPGHIPANIVKKEVGEMRVWQEACAIVLPQMYAKAIIDNKLEAIGQPKVNVEKIAPNNPLVFTAEVALLPEFKLPEYKNIKIKEKKVEVKDSEVDAALKQLQTSRTHTYKVEREAKKDDMVVVDFKTFLDNIPVDKGQSVDHPIVIGEGRFIPGFEDQLVGLKANDKKEFKLNFPKDYHQKNLAGKEVEFKVEVKSVNERHLPELNDEFAKKLGKFQSMVELKSEIKKNMELEAKEKARGSAEMELMDKIADKASIELPEVLVESELNKMLEELKGMVQSSGGQFDQYLQSLKKTEEELKKDLRERAEKRVKIGLILREITKQEKIAVDEKELEHEIEHTASHYQHDPKMVEKIKSEDYKEYARGLMQNKKVFEMLRKTCIEEEK
ncbi:MAG: trigger factor [Patescibacteria group bacterium]|nr:trigger factor [Patescibacteria group bacterium]